MTEKEKMEIAGRVANMLSSKYKKEILEEVKEFLPDVIGDVKKRVKEEVEPKINNIMKNFESFLEENNFNKMLIDEARWIILRALRNQAEEWARRCVKGVKFSFDEIYKEDD